MVEVHGHGTALLVTFCKALATDAKDLKLCSGMIVVQGMALVPDSGQLRSLGYIGSHMLEYRSAEQLLQAGEGLVDQGGRWNMGGGGGKGILGARVVSW